MASKAKHRARSRRSYRAKLQAMYSFYRSGFFKPVTAPTTALANK